MSTYSFDTDDVFDRKRYAQFLCSVIQNSDSFRRADENRSYTICLDSGYGTGKTVFLSKLRDMIEAGFDNNKIAVVSYNAWENDFYQNAFEPFLYSLLNEKWFDIAREADKANKMAKDAKDKLISTGKGIVKALVKNKLGEEAAEIIKSIMDRTAAKEKGPMEDALSDYKKFKDNIAGFNESLECCIIAWQLNKLVVIIDELDRCRPDFALRTLEITKHLMNVKNVVFLFALDKSQLGKAVENIYGYGMDADGYLCKFFDYVTVMPKPSIKSYIDAKDINSMESREREPYRYFIAMLNSMFKLSLRDIDTIMTNFIIMNKTILKSRRNFTANRIYLVCLAMKYKYPDIFYKMFVTDQYDKDGLVNNSIVRHLATIPFIKSLIDNAGKKIGDIDAVYTIMNIQGEECIKLQGITDIDEENFTYCVNRPIKERLEHLTIEKNYSSIDGIIFREDWVYWRRSKNMTYGMFIHRNLEMLNFEP